MLLPHQRESIEQAFACPVFDYYGLAERAVFASECEQHRGLHLNADFGLCELLDEQDRPVTDLGPMFVTRQMIDQIAGDCTTLVKVVVTDDEVHAGHERMVFGQFEQAAAQQMLGPIAHQDAARQLLPHI